jgi:peptidoglycan/LPS O-acetylase OafA/YrhL
MIAHIAQTAGLPFIPLFVTAQLAARGGWGVTVFFVISGFLITYLLLLEERHTGSISLKRFYGRRAVRILPPAFLYLAVVALLGYAGWVTVTRREIISSIFFFRNLVNAPDIYTAHFWSLAIEEQFYLCWPVTMKLVPPRWRIGTTAMLCMAAPVWRHWNLAHFAADWRRADLLYDYLLTGALLALLNVDPTGRAVIDRFLRRPTFILIGAVAVVLSCQYLTPPGLPGRIVLLMTPLQLWAIGTVVLIVSRGLCRPAQALLNARPVAWVGRVSYGLYLWQQPFLRGAGLEIMHSIPLATGATFTAASLSYYVVERPCLRLRARLRAWTPRTTAPVPDAAARSSTVPIGS